jgi:DNA-binding MarR family transcriptional regulator
MSKEAAAKNAGDALELDAFLPYRLSIAATAVSKLVATAYARKFDLSIPEWRLIAVLHQDGASTQAALVRRTMMDKVAVSRAAQALEDRGLIRRTGHETDGRAVRATLTRSGRALYAAIAPAALGYEQRLLSSFTRSEIRQLHDMLDRLIAAARAPGGLD